MFVIMMVLPKDLSGSMEKYSCRADTELRLRACSRLTVDSRTSPHRPSEFDAHLTVGVGRFNSFSPHQTVRVFGGKRLTEYGKNIRRRGRIRAKKRTPAGPARVTAGAVDVEPDNYNSVRKGLTPSPRTRA